MNKWLINFCLCIMALSLFSCSKEYDDNLINLQTQVDLNAVYASLRGKYYGSWWINDEQVSDGSSCVRCLSDGYSGENVIPFEPTRDRELPCKAIAERLFPDMDVANLPYNSVQSRFNAYSPLPVGYSDNILYLTLQPKEGDAYVPYWFQIFKDNTDDHIIAIALDIVPYESIIMLDKDSQSLTLKWLVKQVEIYEYNKGQEELKSVRELNPEMKLTFIGSRKND